MPDTHAMVHKRSDGRCEAMVRVGRTYARCWRYPIEVHHMLTRSRGGVILDNYGETAHLIGLCNQHHRAAHAPGGHKSGLMIDGYVTSGADGVPVYEGQDQRLDRYRVGVPGVWESVSRARYGQRLRGQS